MGKEELQLIITSVAATVGFLSLCFVVRNRIIDKKKSLSITYTAQARLTVYSAKYSGTFIIIYMRNLGGVNLFMSRPYIKLPFKKNEFDMYEMINLKDCTAYPVKIEPGEECSMEMGLEKLLETISHLKWYRRIRFEARDSAGNIYKSKKILVKRFLEHGELHEALSQDNS